MTAGQDIDRLIEEYREKAKKLMLPDRMRLKRASPDDGCDNYLTEVEMLMRRPLVENYMEKAELMRQLKCFIDSEESKKGNK